VHSIISRRGLFAFLAVLLAAAIFAAWRSRVSSKEELLLLCGAGLRPAVSELAELFTAQSGVSVRVDYNAGSLLLGRIRVGADGDLFMPGDEYYIRLAEKDGLVRESRTAAVLVPVILVAPGNPKQIRTLSDLARDGVRLGLADERTAAIGRIAVQLMEKNAVPRDAVMRNLVFESVTVPELGAAVALEHIDAAIVWAPTAAGFANTEAVPIPPNENILANAPIAVLNSSKHLSSARAFCELVLSEPGQAVLRKHGYETPLKEKEPKP